MVDPALPSKDIMYARSHFVPFISILESASQHQHEIKGWSPYVPRQLVVLEMYVMQGFQPFRKNMREKA